MRNFRHPSDSTLDISIQFLTKSHLRTWLNQTYWVDSGIFIHPIFLLGIERDPFGRVIELDPAEKLFDDIIQGDFLESHYNLVRKDRAFNPSLVESWYYW